MTTTSIADSDETETDLTGALDTRRGDPPINVRIRQSPPTEWGTAPYWEAAAIIADDHGNPDHEDHANGDDLPGLRAALREWRDSGNIVLIDVLLWLP